MNVSAKNVFFSRFMAWMLAALVAGYYLMPNLFVSGVSNRFSLSRLKLGIDLRGGTYITLGVEVEKALESRLGRENKRVDALLKSKSIDVRFEKTLFDKATNTVVLSLRDEEAAKRVFNAVKSDISTLRATRTGSTVRLALSPAEEMRIRNDSVEQAVQVISSRVQSLGVEGIIVQRHGSQQVVVQLPGVDDPDRVKNLITRRAHLEFKIIQDRAGNKDALLDKYDGDLPADKLILPGESAQEYEDQETSGVWYLTSAYPDLTGDHIVDARVTYGEYGQPQVTFKFDREGGKTFRELTGNNINRQLGIIIDNVVYSAPNISEAIGSEGRISGRYTFETAKDLAIVLKTGAFQAPVTYQQERRIGPSLGQDSINRGLLSCFIGLGLVLLFALFYYKIGGLLAMLALIYNLLLILLFLSYFNATLTLPGIAGMVLTIGMAIDASILIYEKIKEELAEGLAFRRAVDAGFSGAMKVILDSNITTFLTGLVLFYFGGPSIQGFAITLMVGIVATVLAGVYFLKATFDFCLDSLGAKTIKL